MKPADSFPKYHPYLLLFIWIVVSVLFFIFHGPRTMFDSHQYLDRAQQLLNGEWIGFRYFWYMGYIIFLALLEWISSDVVLWAVVLQVLISGIAAIYVYKSTLLISGSKNTPFSTHQRLPVNDVLPSHIKLQEGQPERIRSGGDVDDVRRGQIGNKWTAFVATLLFICWYKIQVWNYFVLTESLFISLLVILFYAVLKYQYNWQTWVLALLILFIRPTGIIVLLATIISLIIVGSVHLKFRYKVIIILFVVVAGGCIVNLVLSNYGLIEEYSEGKIVYSADQVKPKSLKEGLFVHPNRPLNTSEFSGYPLLDGFRFFISNPLYTVKLVGTRMLYYVLDYRPYHSTVHKFVNTILLLVCYGLTAIFIVKAKDQKLSKTWFLVFLIGNVLMAGFTCLTWEGRFFAPLYPFLFIFSCSGGALIHTRSQAG